MTVSYTGSVANASRFGIFSKILLRWRGSVYKLIYKELLAYIVMYMVINLTYRTVLVPKSECDQTLPSCERWRKHREMFETLRLYVNQNLNSIPLIFVLGFYVSLIVKRWWDQYELLPWPDSFGMTLCGLFKVNNDDRGRMLRRNMMRYIILSYCIALRTVSFRLKKRFPTLEHLVHAGIMREDEFREFQRLDEKVTANKWFLPLVWAGKMIGAGVEQGNVQPPNGTTIMAQLGKVRRNLTTILTYDWISVPLVYTQVVTLAVYLYFLASLFGAQWVMPATEELHKKIYKTTARLDLFYPFFLTLQFAFYVGWLKVAETLINPFGEDDDDFELNRLIDRHIQVGFLISDPIVEKPDLLKDKFWNEIIPQEMLYTVNSAHEMNTEFQGSAEVTLEIKDSEKIYSEDQIYCPAPRPRKRVKSSSETIYESIRSRRNSKPDPEKQKARRWGLREKALAWRLSRAKAHQAPAFPTHSARGRLPATPPSSPALRRAAVTPGLPRRHASAALPASPLARSGFSATTAVRGGPLPVAPGGQRGTAGQLTDMELRENYSIGSL